MSIRETSLALQLIERLLESSDAWRIFTSDEAVAQGAGLGLSPTHTYKLLSELTAKQLLDRPRTRLYATRPPFGGTSPVRAIPIAVHAARPAAVSGETALAYWGLLEQVPVHEEVVSTSARVRWKDTHPAGAGDVLWPVTGSTIRFRHVLAGQMFGITTVRLDVETVVPIFDRERTILELLLHPGGGQAAWAAEILRARRDDVQLARLREYARRVGLTRALSRALARDTASVDEAS